MAENNKENQTEVQPETSYCKGRPEVLRALQNQVGNYSRDPTMAATKPSTKKTAVKTISKTDGMYYAS